MLPLIEPIIAYAGAVVFIGIGGTFIIMGIQIFLAAFK